MPERQYLVKWNHPETGKQERTPQMAESAQQAVSVFWYQQGNAGVNVDRSKTIAREGFRFTIRTPNPSIFTLVFAWDREDAIDEGFEHFVRESIKVAKAQLTAERS